jgi:hypothetical protein
LKGFNIENKILCKTAWEDGYAAALHAIDIQYV